MNPLNLIAGPYMTMNDVYVTKNDYKQIFYTYKQGKLYDFLSDLTQPFKTDNKILLLFILILKYIGLFIFFVLFMVMAFYHIGLFLLIMSILILLHVYNTESEIRVTIV
jgi:hypothetical protein